ncbi:MAG: DedA family protein [Myxococcales bacterium]|nr:DedA family protein [Myxococcales bacterium]
MNDAPGAHDPTNPAPPAPSTPPPSTPRNPIRRVYEWVLRWAETPYGVPALFVLAFIESSFFPIPPDVLLIALALSVPTRAFRFAAWCTLGSVLGGLFGYFIGYALWATFQPYLIPRVFSAEKFAYVTAKYNEYGELAVFIAAFTPIPYKVFTVAAGVAKLNLLGFVGASIVGRGGRFFLVALVIRTAGPTAKQLIDKYFNLVTIAGTLLLIGGFLLLRGL